MARQQYALKSFLRQAPRPLVLRYITEREVGKLIAESTVRSAQVTRLFSELQELPLKVQREMEYDFHLVHMMANEGGIRTIVEEGRDSHHDLDLRSRFADLASYLEMSFWTFLEHPAVFRTASQLHRADVLPQKWRKRPYLPDVEPSTDAATTLRLGKAISAYYDSKEGRGQVCLVDHYRRGERLYWFAYPQDYPMGALVYDARRRLRVSTQRPAFEVVFIHTPEERSLDVWVQGDKDTLRDLQIIWARTVLGVELGPTPGTPVVYELDGLASRDYRLPLRHEDGVDDVRITRLRLRLLAWGGQHLTIEASASQGPKAIYDVLEALARAQSFEKDQLQVVSAGFRLAFRETPFRRRQILHFNVSHPDSCSLKSDEPDEVAKQLLRRWGIDVSTPSIDNSEDTRQSLQRTFRV